MVYLQIKKIKNKTLYTLNIYNKVHDKDTNIDVSKSATEYLSPIEYDVLLKSNLFLEKEMFIKED